MLLVFGAGTGFALQSNWPAGLPGAWMEIPHVMLPPSAVHKGVPEPDPSAGVARPRAQTKIAIGSRHTRASSHARGLHRPSLARARAQQRPLAWAAVRVVLQRVVPSAVVIGLLALAPPARVPRRARSVSASVSRFHRPITTSRRPE